MGTFLSYFCNLYILILQYLVLRQSCSGQWGAAEASGTGTQGPGSGTNWLFPPAVTSLSGPAYAARHSSAFAN